MPVAARQTAARPMHGIGHRRIRNRIARHYRHRRADIGNRTCGHRFHGLSKCRGSGCTRVCGYRWRIIRAQHSCGRCRGKAPRQHCPRRPIDECDGRMFGIARSAGCNSNAGYRQRYGDKPITVGWLGGRNRKELRCRECVMRRDRARWPEPCWLWWWALRSRWRQVWATS